MPEDDGRIPRIIGKIGIIEDRVVRGGYAVNIWQVKFYRMIRVVSIILTTLGGAGLVAVNVKPDFGQQYGWALVGSLLSLILSILIQLSSELGIDRKASQALSARDSFRLVDMTLEVVLRNQDPTIMVDKLLNETDALMIKFFDVIFERSVDSTVEATRKTAGLVERFGPIWELPPTGRRPRNDPRRLPPVAPDPGPGGTTGPTEDPPLGQVEAEGAPPEDDPPGLPDDGGTRS